ncbi:hypothetical protein HMPREF1544_08781 [Mucor circinelloides 1006PhL]|uniref:BRCT domain-containing protein n=1 Tax=Mucor circinelloides f. circinelloides (strain 1006PhL) TaxID=1220926 RepID=S2J7Z8_MUCC1|nr:hypothetical protein HMPREF1544_08781 [Mucor circinelloides 1006PhL]
MDQLNPAEPYQGAVQHFMQTKQEFERANGIDLSTVEIMNLPEDRNMEMSPEAPDLGHGLPSTQQPKYRILQMTENPIKHINIPDARLEQKVTADVTHAVFDTVGKSDLVKNTQKYRMAIACGYHIVSETWLKISIEKGSIQSPERFHVYGDETYGRTGAPKKAWESRDKKKGHLLRHLKVGLIDDVKGEYRKYLIAARATIGDFDDLIVCKLDQDMEALRSKYPGKNLISCKWIEASICRYELDDKSKYIL